jgi:ferrous iron transport protein A
MESHIKLRDMRSGQRGTVTDLGMEDRERFRLMEMGLIPGTELRFVRRAPMGGPIEVEMRGLHLSLRAQEASNIIVQVES